MRWIRVLVYAALGWFPTDQLLADEISAPASLRAEDVEFFERRIRPVLVTHCYECHSQAAKDLKGGLYVDTRAGLLRGGDSGPAVVPGDPEQSLLLEALRYGEESYQMPPKGKLSAEVIADFAKWIESGAADPRSGDAPALTDSLASVEAGRSFWAFQPVARPAVPDVRDTAWARTDIDRFVLARLEAQGLKPGADDEPHRLIRRAYFDLIGLPPPVDEVERFVQNRQPEAWAELVDRLLTSPHFGERWGRHWLDVARFAESSGGGRELLFPNAWRYRDYVIRSFNNDKPYDRFVTEQVAGDLLPWESDDQRAEQLTASGFLMLGPINYELQDKELLRMEVVDEQIDTIGRALLGMTLGCARCHDHKFDPVPTADYYALAGIFRSTKSLVPGNVSGFVEQSLPVPPEQQAALDRNAEQMGQIKSRLDQAKAELQKLKDRVGPKLDLANLPGIVVDDAQAAPTGSWTASTAVSPFVGQGYRHDGNADKGQKSIVFRPALPAAGKYEVRIAYTTGDNRATNVPVTVEHADGEATVLVNQRKAPPIDGLLVSIGQFSLSADSAVTISNRDTDGHVIADAVQFLPLDSGEPPAEADDDPEKLAERKLAEQEITAAEAHLRQLEAELKTLEKNAPPPAPKVMSVKDEDEPGDFAICVRGNVHQLGKAVPRGFLQVVSGGEPVVIRPGESGRRELAEWIASAENPLTARVMVNRIWHHLLGAGLVRTVDNFGATGEPPSHAELLDYLADRFVAEGWSTKKIIREIMLSRVYQLSCADNPAAAAIDVENRLLWRANRRRLDAEAMRDAVLTVSGQLDLTIGGPGFDEKVKSEIGYQYRGHRRSVYVPVFRNALHELFEVFDVADPNIVSGRRNRTTLPTQALYLMNGDFVPEQSAQTAARLLAAPGLDDAGRLDLVYRWIFGRPPRKSELELALRYLNESGAGGDAVSDEARRAAWARLVQVLFASIDFRYIN